MDASYFSFGTAFTALSQPAMSGLSVPACSSVSQPEMSPAHKFGVSAAIHFGDLPALHGPIVEPIYHSGLAKPVLGRAEPIRPLFNQPVQAHSVTGTHIDTRL